MTEVTALRALLTAARQRLTAELTAIDRALEALGVPVQTNPTGEAKPSLRSAILMQLRQGPLALRPLAEAVLENGFSTQSKNFRGTVSGMLTQMGKAGEVRRGAAGYTLAPPAKGRVQQRRKRAK